MYQRLFELHADITKTLANRKRLEIVHLLLDRELSVSDMVEMLGLPQANLSQHLAIMRSKKIVNTRRDGNSIYYSLSDPKIAQAYQLLRDFLKEHYEVSSKDIKAIDSFSTYPLVVDPVCGMRFSVKDAAFVAERGNKRYYFCAQGCHNKFIMKG